MRLASPRWHVFASFVVSRCDKYILLYSIGSNTLSYHNYIIIVLSQHHLQVLMWERRLHSIIVYWLSFKNCCRNRLETVYNYWILINMYVYIIYISVYRMRYVVHYLFILIIFSFRKSYHTSYTKCITKPSVFKFSFVFSSKREINLCIEILMLSFYFKILLRILRCIGTANRLPTAVTLATSTTWWARNLHVITA